MSGEFFDLGGLAAGQIAFLDVDGEAGFELGAFEPDGVGPIMGLSQLASGLLQPP